MLIVQPTDFKGSPDERYRSIEPLRALSNLPGVLAIAVHISHPWLRRLAETADVLLLPSIHDREYFPILERRKQAGKLSVFDVNDLFQDLPPCADLATSWAHPEPHAEHKAFISRCDIVQATSEGLFANWVHTARRIVVVPNQLTELNPVERNYDQKGFVLGWGGSFGHMADWHDAASVLQPWLVKHPEVILKVMADEVMRDFISLPKEQYTFVPRGDHAAYISFLQSIDVGVAPLLPTDFNRCRSDLKFIEYASCSVVPLLPAPGPYDLSAQDGETALLYRSPEELLLKLERLLEDSQLRRRIVDASFEYVQSKRLLKNNIAQRYDLYREWYADGRSCEGRSAVVDIIKQAEGLVSLTLPAPWNEALAQFENAPTAQTLERYLPLITQSPEFEAGSYRAAKLANDLNLPKVALQTVERPLEINTTSARLISEKARALYLLGDFPAAMTFMSVAVERNPMFLAGYKYLLIFATALSATARQTLQQRIERQFPESYRLRLLASRWMPGEERIAFVQRLLEEFAEKLSGPLLEVSQECFAGHISDAVQGHLLTEPALRLLAGAVEHYPSSIRIGTLYAKSLHLQGREPQSLLEYKRVQKIFKIAREFLNESGKMRANSDRLWLGIGGN